MLVHENPQNDTLEARRRLAASEKYLRLQNVLGWVDRCLEAGRVVDGLSLDAALAFVRDPKYAGASAAGPDEDMGQRSGARAGVAALVINFGDAEEEEVCAWARTMSLASVPTTFRREDYSLSDVPWHAAGYAALALAGDIRRSAALADARQALMRLVAHPQECVSLRALGAALSLWDVHPRFAWDALQLSLSLCLSATSRSETTRESIGLVSDLENREATVLAIASRVGPVEAWESLPLPPSPWVRDQRSTEEIWRPSETRWSARLAARIVAMVPVRSVIATQGAREAFQAFCSQALDWTIEKVVPPWAAGTGKSHGTDTGVYEWRSALGQLLGTIAGHLDFEVVKHAILEPIFALDEEHLPAFLEPLISRFVAVHVLDAEHAIDHAGFLLEACLNRFLEDNAFDRRGHRAGELGGFHRSSLVQDFFFVSVDGAMAAARFANGDWSDIATVLPIVDRFVRAAGWAAEVIGPFLTLVERARSHYPHDLFADQILSILSAGPSSVKGWRGTSIALRIAVLIQDLSDRHTPLSISTAQKMLRVLDHLVEMGDRRSAALQQSETFRETLAA